MGLLGNFIVNGFIGKFYCSMGLLENFIGKWVNVEILLVNGVFF